MDTVMQYLPIILGGLGALLLLVIAILIFKKLNKRVRGRRGQRLGITEYHEVDETRRLVLIRRDDVEHLVLIGGPQDVLIESRINLNDMPTYGSGQHAHMGEAPSLASAPIPIRPAPRAPVFAERRPVPLRPVEPSLTGRHDQNDEI